MTYRIDVVGTEDELPTLFHYSVHGNPEHMSLNLRFSGNGGGSYSMDQVYVIMKWLESRNWLAIKSITLMQVL